MDSIKQIVCCIIAVQRQSKHQHGVDQADVVNQKWPPVVSGVLSMPGCRAGLRASSAGESTVKVGLLHLLSALSPNVNSVSIW